LKALDFSRAFRSKDPARQMQSLTAAYNFERDLLVSCNNKRLTHVIHTLADGVYCPTDGIPVHYLIFELAEGDIRNFVDFSKAFDLAWALRSLHNSAVGLMQLHKNGVAHQDVKPSNILVFPGNLSKIGDVGRASVRDNFNNLHDNLDYAGDPDYAPIELLYNNINPDWNVRRLACDLYLFGSLVFFLYLIWELTSALLTLLDDSHHYLNWTGNYSEVLPYIRQAYNDVLIELKTQLNKNPFSSDIVEMVKQLCDPDPLKRGHPLNHRQTNPFSLERYVSKLDSLATRAELNLTSIGVKKIR